MSVFLQIMVVNLLVSCDNVGVIALAARNLPPDKAVLARRVGIGLSLGLKMLFVALVSILFDITWLHIRIIGGILLLYVTFSMLRQSAPRGDGCAQGPRADSHRGGGEHFFTVIVSIVAADVSMSLDNVIAILSIVSQDGGSLGPRELLLIFGGLALCVPLLLWFSGTVTRLMERYALLTYLCAGYLVYTAMEMIFADTTLVYFFNRINFTLASPVAVLCGVMIVLYGVFHNPRLGSSGRVRRAFLRINFFVVIHTLISLGGISYLSTNPVLDGRRVSVEAVYGVSLQGASAVYALLESFTMLTLCTAVFTGICAFHSAREGYQALFSGTALAMGLFTVSALGVSTVGLTLAFGFGSIPLAGALGTAALLLCLLISYAAVFSMLASFARNQFGCTALSMLYVLLEHILAEICVIDHAQPFLASFFPSYYISRLPYQATDPVFLARGLLLSLLVTGFASLTGSLRRPVRAAHPRRTPPIPLPAPRKPLPKGLS